MTKIQSVSRDIILNKIFIVNGYRILLDSDLAEMYQVETKVLNQAVKRNIERFPDDFMFQLGKEEWESLRSQIETSKPGGRRYMPYAFTENGIAMLSSVLTSKVAIKVNIEIIRVFTRMRELLLSHKDLLLKVEKLEQKLSGQDDRMRVIFDYLKELIQEKEIPRTEIGFKR